MLQQLHSAPAHLYDCDATALHQHFPEPTLIHLDGIEQRPVFVSILLHGNETTGLHVIQAILQKYQKQPLPRAISLFLGNTEAASQSLRRLPGQPDFNRIWPGTRLAKSEYTEMASQVFSVMAAKKPFASIDIHNNTGRNPHYCCITDKQAHHLQLARRFDRLVVYLNRMHGLQSGAFASLCPSVTLECGQPGEASGITHASEFLDDILNLDTIPDTPLQDDEIDLFHNVAQTHINPEISFSFSDLSADLILSGTLDHLNFTEVGEGTALGKLNRKISMPLIATDEAGKNVSHHYFKCDNDQLVLSRPVIPSMITLDEKVVVQDCFCYLMERLNL